MRAPSWRTGTQTLGSRPSAGAPGVRSGSVASRMPAACRNPRTSGVVWRRRIESRLMSSIAPSCSE
ncbi:hypothetical protein [Nonomuraea dietziae]|uniref:Uncharacterized protein n=2 Tax=Nonomuraea TaxID=83681 RepID=A0A7W5V7E3_9ACTN|nr:hypothetical protein [Nonomuraea dietziae]MBB3726829.1 hypothetical protein [Nonomuraea dietziae]